VFHTSRKSRHLSNRRIVERLLSISDPFRAGLFTLPTPVRYLLAVGVTLLALWVRYMLIPWLGPYNTYHTLWAALVFSAWYLGVGPSIVTVIVGIGGIWYWFIPPIGSFSLLSERSRYDLAGMCTFALLAGALIALAHQSRRTRAKLAKSEFRFRRLVDSNIIPIVCANMQGITEANDAFLNMIGYTREELLSGSIEWIKMTPPEDLGKDARALEELKKTGYCTPYEKQYVLRNGSRVSFLIGGAMLNLSPLEWLCFVVDLRDLKRVEAELRRTHEELEQKVAERTRELAQTVSSLQSEMQTRRTTEQQLRELSARLLRLQDEERRRLARDLHDSTGQTLTALKMTAASLQRVVAGVPQASKLVHDLNARADEALQEIRSMSHLLHPPLLDEVGFASAARWYVEGFAKRSGIRSNLDLASVPQLNKEEELVFFRVLQESLTNVLRHSGSTVVDIRLTCDGKNGVLSIKDYGKGIASEKLEGFRETGAGVGVGLGGMKQRLRELGGHLRLESERTGTCVIATLPLPQGGNDNSYSN
jgi:PAS domain S-box-containing protein